MGMVSNQTKIEEGLNMAEEVYAYPEHVIFDFDDQKEVEKIKLILKPKEEIRKTVNK